MTARLAQAARSLGIAGWLGLALLVAGALLQAFGVQPLEARLRAAEAAVRAQVRGAPGEGRLLAVSAEDGRITRFVGFFRNEAQVTDQLARLYAIAAQSGVAFSAAEYQLSPVRPLDLERYTITLPIRGGYAQARAFMENALEQIPVLTLEQASFRRGAGGAQSIETEVRLSIYRARP